MAWLSSSYPVNHAGSSMPSGPFPYFLRLLHVYNVVCICNVDCFRTDMDEELFLHDAALTGTEKPVLEELDQWSYIRP